MRLFTCTPILLLLLFFSACITEHEPDRDPVSVMPGDPCPEFTVTLLDGSTVSTRDLAGHKTLLLFFNTSCDDCRAELPVVQGVYEQFSTEGKDVRFLCISREQGDESVSAYWSDNNLTMPVSAQESRVVYSLFASSVIPRIYIISPTLTITNVWTDDPMPSASDLIAALE